MTRPTTSAQIQHREAAKQQSRAADERALANETRTRAQLSRENAFLPANPHQKIDFRRIARIR